MSPSTLTDLTFFYILNLEEAHPSGMYKYLSILQLQVLHWTWMNKHFFVYSFQILVVACKLTTPCSPECLENSNSLLPGDFVLERTQDVFPIWVDIIVLLSVALFFRIFRVFAAAPCEESCKTLQLLPKNSMQMVVLWYVSEKETP